jgi:hypothetical protein
MPCDPWIDTMTLDTTGCNVGSYPSSDFNCDPVSVVFSVSLNAACCGDIDTTELLVTN